MNKSETITKLATALVKAQATMGAATKDSANPFFKSKYADLGSVIEAIKEPLNKNGISFLQVIDIDAVETVLMHESGEFLSGRTAIIVAKANDPQAMGSAVTYAKRYGLQAILGIPSEDDDGNLASGKSTAPAKFTKPSTTTTSGTW